MFLSWRKKQARKAAQARRILAHRTHPDAGRALVAHFPDALWPAIGTVVAGYRAFGPEIDAGPLMESFHLEQVRLALPRVVGRGQPLTFHHFSPGDSLIKGPFGVEEPAETADHTTPKLVLVPLLAADLRGYRLGYGAGYYDMTLAALRKAGSVTAVGLCYDEQIVAKVPAGRLDEPVDWIVTERRAIRIAK
ncbi:MULTISPECIES: 5-formyltetrahydrofolate cyclo-ligase [Hyphobacterium]|uniref:5-formyltetrahydrofolate cyclo-ligase n=1 Tax=Hyphobacterium vulgare TaxID=1736751 RepID=A0ABV6ZYV1_9PROT